MILSMGRIPMKGLTKQLKDVLLNNPVEAQVFINSFTLSCPFAYVHWSIFYILRIVKNNMTLVLSKIYDKRLNAYFEWNSEK